MGTLEARASKSNGLTGRESISKCTPMRPSTNFSGSGARQVPRDLNVRHDGVSEEIAMRILVPQVILRLHGTFVA